MRILFSKQTPIVSQFQNELRHCDKDDQLLDLGKNRLDKIPVSELIEMIHLLKDSQIKTIDMTSTGIQLMPVADITQVIQAVAQTSVNTLIFADNWLGVKKTDAELREIFQSVAGTQVINYVDLSGNGLGSQNRASLGETLKILGLSEVKWVRLDNNSLNRLGGTEDVARLIYDSLHDKALFQSTDQFTLLMNDYLKKLNEASAGVIPSPNPHHFYYQSNPDKKNSAPHMLGAGGQKPHQPH